VHVQDRIVYFYVDAHGNQVLLDGDKILSLLAELIAMLLKEAGIDASLGIVQVGLNCDRVNRS
jgi:hypothetical protein